MSWVLMAAFGLGAWLFALAFVLALCRAASRADELPSGRIASTWVSSDSNVVDLCAFRATRRAVRAPTSAASRAAGP
jgi:hypothetical protein